MDNERSVMINSIFLEASLDFGYRIAHRQVISAVKDSGHRSTATATATRAAIIAVIAATAADAGATAVATGAAAAATAAATAATTGNHGVLAI